MFIKKNIESIVPYQPGVFKAGAIKLASNENPLGPAPLALKAIQENLNKISLYPDGSCFELRNALAKFYGLKPEQFLIGNGSDEIFVFAAGAVISPGDEMLTSECTFSEYAFATKLFDGIPVYVPQQNGKYQLVDFLAKISPRTKLICIANPNNPTGTYVTQEELIFFMQKVPQDVLVLVDEAYFEYVTAEDYPKTIELLPKYPNLLITRTFSKIYGLAGLRVGYAIGGEKLINALNKVREPFNVNSLAQVAAKAALSDQDFVRKSVQNNIYGKRYLYAEFSKLGLKFFNSEGNFIFVELPILAQEAFVKLMELGVTVRPMNSFGCPKAIRVTIGTAEQNKFFIEKLKEIL